MENRIHIMGASGSGTSTLGKALAEVLRCNALDTDDYFWISKFTEQRPIPDRIEMLKNDLSKSEKWVLSGAVVKWGECLESHFDLVVFLWVPPQTRLARLQQREIARYGEEVLPGGDKYEQSQTFLKWAALYDHAGMEVRSKILHEQWMQKLSCPILRIEGDYSIEECVTRVKQYLDKNI
ncbi:MULTISPECIES: AAA family ATPase [Exiguobacterium]|uniref:ATP-binding protein n=1 Tax=Exiguobacterium TaxID=33986 RepID=UPI00047DC825|nr:MULTISPECIES: AAA family ATPase [Exiguobacterium]MCK2156042.1 AAA family ATPase [Exiguobacterium sp. 17-1]